MAFEMSTESTAPGQGSTGGAEQGLSAAHIPVSHGPWAARSRWLREAPRPSPIRNRPNAHWLAVASVCVGAFMGQLDASIVTVAFPALQRSFHAGLASVTWVGLSYMLVLVAGVTVVGRLADMVGRKLLYTYGFIVFIIGSALCATAPNLLVLDAFRVVQAFGAAMLQANSVAIIALAAPSRDLGRAIGYQGAAQALGLALGPTVGGLLLAFGGWQLIFLVNVPFGILGVIAGLVFIPRSRHLAPWKGWSRFDWPGVFFLFAATVCLLYGVSFGDTAGWGAPQILVTLVVGALLVAAFIVHELRCSDALFDVRLFSRWAFSAGIVRGMLCFLVLFGVLLIVPFYLEHGHGLGSGLAGATLMAMPLALGIVAPLAGRLADKRGARLPTTVGMLLMASSLVVMGMTRPAPGVLALDLFVLGAGLGLCISPNNAAIMGSAPVQRSGAVSGVINMTRGLGTALGLALTGLVFTRAGGESFVAAKVIQAFGHSGVFLGVVAGLGIALAAFGGRSRLVATKGSPQAGDAL